MGGELYGTLLMVPDTMTVMWSPYRPEFPLDNYRGNRREWVWIGGAGWYPNESAKAGCLALKGKLGDLWPSHPGEWVRLSEAS